MKFPEALESRMYGNPEAILEAKQAAQAREKQHGKRRILTVKPNWSAARQRAEELFTADPAAQPFTDHASRNGSLPGGSGKDSA